MRFLILGASGRTGQLAVQDALGRGHTVTALVRKASSLEKREGLTIFEGTPLDPEDIKRAFAATSSEPVNCVIVALNATRTSDSPFAKPLAPPHFIEDCVRNATSVMAVYGIKRIVVMSAFGIGSSHDQLPWLVKQVFKHTNMSYQVDDHEATDANVHAQQELDWTLVRPVMLKKGDTAPVKKLGEEGKGAGLLSGITRASVAEFMVKVAEDQAWSKKAVVILN